MSWRERFARNKLDGVFESYIACLQLTRKLPGDWHRLTRLYNRCIYKLFFAGLAAQKGSEAGVHGSLQRNWCLEGSAHVWCRAITCFAIPGGEPHPECRLLRALHPRSPRILPAGICCGQLVRSSWSPGPARPRGAASWAAALGAELAWDELRAAHSAFRAFPSNSSKKAIPEL